MTHISPSIASLRKSISAATTPSARTAAVKRLRRARRDRRRYRTNAKLSTISLARPAPSRVPMTLSIAEISTCRSDWREEAARFGRVRFGQASPASGHVCNEVHHKPQLPASLAPGHVCNKVHHKPQPPASLASGHGEVVMRWGGDQGRWGCFLIYHLHHGSTCNRCVIRPRHPP